MSNMIQLNPNDLLTLTTADGTLVEMRVQHISPPQPETEPQRHRTFEGGALARKLAGS